MIDNLPLTLFKKKIPKQPYIKNFLPLVDNNNPRSGISVGRIMFHDQMKEFRLHYRFNLEWLKIPTITTN